MKKGRRIINNDVSGFRMSCLVVIVIGTVIVVVIIIAIMTRQKPSQAYLDIFY